MPLKKVLPMLVISVLLVPAISVSAETTPQSSIKVPYQKTSESKEETNTMHLQKLAKITPLQAEHIALKHQNGKLGKVDLENEDGNLLYSVEVGNLEVVIDAGNGKILKTEKK